MEDKADKTVEKSTRIPANYKTIIDSLIKMELEASRIYYAMGSWCDATGFPGGSKFFRKHCMEEQVHAEKHYEFLWAMNLTPCSPSINAILTEKDFTGLGDILEKAYAHEQMVTNRCADVAKMAQKDCPLVFTHIQFYLKEQIEEEELFSTLLDQARILGDSGLALMHLDEILGEKAG